MFRSDHDHLVHPGHQDRSAPRDRSGARPRRPTPPCSGYLADAPTRSTTSGFDVEGQHIGLVPGGGPEGATSPVAYWQVPDIEAKLAEVTAAGGAVKDAPREVGGGRVVATFTDPDGNVLGLVQDQ